jgi:hypothetical protein
MRHPGKAVRFEWQPGAGAGSKDGLRPAIGRLRLLWRSPYGPALRWPWGNLRSLAAARIRGPVVG